MNPSFEWVDFPLGNIHNLAPVWADFDNDGDLDLLCPSFIGGRTVTTILRLWRNDGAAGFTSIETEILGVGHGRYIVADYDRDGRLDVGVAGLEYESTGVQTYRSRLYHNEGAFRFKLVADGWPLVHSGSFDFGDSDRDGDLDLLHFPLSDPSVPGAKSIIQWNMGTGDFSPSHVDYFPSNVGPARWLDVDSDGELDIALEQSMNGPPYPLYYQNKGAGEFVAQFAPLDLPEVRGISWADFNGDGRSDAIVWDRFGNASILVADPNGGFVTPAPRLDYHPDIYRCDFGDFDNDGDLDCLVSLKQANFVGLCRNRGSGDFEFVTTFLSGSASAAAWADFDRDGDLDIAVTSGYGSLPSRPTHLLRNALNTPNTPPTTPTDTVAFRMPNGGVRLQWSASTDAESTRPRMLTYEVRVGTAPGAGDIAMPPADLVTGERRVAAPGAERTTFRWMRGLPPGTYYWSVQAVDTVFAGSAWAPESTFTVTETTEITRIENWNLQSDGSLILECRAPAGSLLLLDFATHPGKGPWTLQRQVRIGASGRETLEVLRTPGVGFYRLRAIR